MRQYIETTFGAWAADKRFGGKSIFIFVFGLGVGLIRHVGRWRMHIFRIVKERE